MFGVGGIRETKTSKETGSVDCTMILTTPNPFTQRNDVDKCEGMG